MRLLLSSLILFLSVVVSESVRAEAILRLSSAPGDFVGGGAQLVLSDVDAVITPSAFPGDLPQNVVFTVNSKDSAHTWMVSFDAPQGQALKIGRYDSARRFPFNGRKAGLEVFGDGRGCNELTGSFEVIALEYIGGELKTFAARFKQYCDGSEAPLKGFIGYNFVCDDNTIVDNPDKTKLSRIVSLEKKHLETLKRLTRIEGQLDAARGALQCR